MRSSASHDRLPRPAASARSGTPPPPAGGPPGPSRSLASASRRSIAATSPLTTLCTGEFSFATTSSSCLATSSQRVVGAAGVRRRAGRPWRPVAPRRPAASPRRGPRPADERVGQRDRLGGNERRELAERVAGHAHDVCEPLRPQNREAATSQASSAGWTNSVVARASSSRHPATRSRPSAADASSSTAAPAGWAGPRVGHPEELRSLSGEDDRGPMTGQPSHR